MSLTIIYRWVVWAARTSWLKLVFFSHLPQTLLSSLFFPPFMRSHIKIPHLEFLFSSGSHKIPWITYAFNLHDHRPLHCYNYWVIILTSSFWMYLTIAAYCGYWLHGFMKKKSANNLSNSFSFLSKLDVNQSIKFI